MRIIKIDSGIVFDNGTTIEDYHECDCCEQVYADFKGSLSDTDIMDIDFKEINIEKVPGSGFRLNGYFVACYNIQNGHYRSDLKPLITENNVTREIDIEDCTESNYRE